MIVSLKKKIHHAKIKISLAIKNQLLPLYWDLGKEINTQIESAEWNTEILDKISVDLKSDFGKIKGLARRNLNAIKQWDYFFGVKFEFVPPSRAQIPWETIVSK